MTKTQATKRLGLTTAAAIGAMGLVALFAGGCELAVTFDRSLIDGGTTEPTGDATTVDVAVDSVAPPTPDTGTDATPTVDTGTDAPTEASGGCSSPADCPSAGDCVNPTCTASTCGTSNVAAGTTCSSNGGKVCDGNGNCVGCTHPTDCPGQTTACVVDTCNSSTCGTSNAPAGATCTDNSGKVCDGNGKCVACAQPTDCAPQSTACLLDTCTSNKCGTSDATSGTTCTDNGGKVCDGSGKCVACLAPTDCPAQTTACKVNTCDATAHTCGTSNVSKGTVCSDNGGIVCDGNGACVATHCTDGVQDADETDKDCGGSCSACADNDKCLVAGDCVSGVCDPTAKTCTPATCSDGVKNGAETDTDCGGATCDAANKKCADKLHCVSSSDCKNNFCFGSGPGTCVSCVDGTKDGNETDTDCGGPQCDAQNKTCQPNQGCGTAADCQSGFCQGNTTCQLRPDGQSCTAAAQCAHGNCVGPAGSGVCCNTACSGNCQACSISETGQPTGTCNNILAGTTAPAGQCAVTTTCGNDGKCASGGVCEQASSSTSCGAVTCNNGLLTPAGLCDGSGACNGGTTTACPGGFICASGTACKTACASDNDCQDKANTYCQNPGASGNCAPKGGPGAACGAVDQCTTGVCGVGGAGTHCCTAACSPTGGTCGATDCNATGACMFPSGTSCGSVGCANGQLTPAGSCDGSGGCTPGTPSACAGGFVCAGPSSCKTACTSDNDCQDKVNNYCLNPGASGTCVPKGAPGATCGATDQCTSSVCGVSGTGTRCCTAACSPTAGTCGASDCDAVGACVFPGNGTSCGTACGSGQLTASACNGTGGCVAGTPSGCPGGFVCASLTACKTACASDNDCQDTAGTYCSNPGPSGTCVSKGGAGAVCTAVDQCTNGICGISGTGSRCCTAACSPTGGLCGATDCSPTGACMFPGGGTVCSPPTCASSSLTTHTCSGTGTCSPTVSSCGNYACNGTADGCLTACGTNDAAGDASCATGFWCDGVAAGACQTPQPATSPCNRDSQCANGTCVGAPSGACN